MENRRQDAGGSSSSRNFDHLFGPKDSSSSSSSSTSGIFGSIFPPPSTDPLFLSVNSRVSASSMDTSMAFAELVRVIKSRVSAPSPDTQMSLAELMKVLGGKDSLGSLRKQGESSKAESSIFSSKDKNSVYQNETAEPSYLSSSIYYGGQENYSLKTKTTTESHPHHVIKKDGGEDDPNGNNANGASRGNWWQGSLYY